MPTQLPRFVYPSGIDSKDIVPIDARNARRQVRRVGSGRRARVSDASVVAAGGGGGGGDASTCSAAGQWVFSMTWLAPMVTISHNHPNSSLFGRWF